MRIDGEQGYVLHTHAYRETSLLVEVFTLSYGRVSLVARGARRPHSAIRARLMAFQPLWVSWFGKGGLRTLHAAEWQGDGRSVSGAALMCGFYLNELLMRLLPQDDPHEGLFEHYAKALRDLADGAEAEPVLRRFELALLSELGYAQTLTHVAETEEPVRPVGRYGYALERGVIIDPETGPILSGKTLLDMAAGDYSDPRTLAEGKLLMRLLLAHYLGDKPLATRQLLIDLQKI